MDKQYAIIVAGGSGKRMKSMIPKQFMEIAGKPILMHTIDAFRNYSPQINIIIVLPEAHTSLWEVLCKKWEFNVPHLLVPGGPRRQDSVKNGLLAIKGEGLVAIHDGVRPFINDDLLLRGFELAAKEGNAVAAVPLKDSIRVITDGASKSLDRANYRVVQTPQTFQVSLIKNAYELAKGEYTDDASLAEEAGYTIKLIEGSYDNIKITTHEDMLIAEQIIKRSRPELL